MLGLVRVNFILGKDGRVHAPYIAMSTDKAFMAPVLEVFSQWRFEPAKLHGKPIDIPTTQDIPFNIIDSDPLSAIDALRVGENSIKHHEYCVPKMMDSPMYSPHVDGLKKPVFVRMRYIVNQEGSVDQIALLNIMNPVVLAYVNRKLGALRFVTGSVDGRLVRWQVSSEMLLFPAEGDSGIDPPGQNDSTQTDK